MSTTHPRSSRTQRLNRTGVTLLLMSVLSFAVAGVTGSSVAGGLGFVFLFVGGWALHEAEKP